MPLARINFIQKEQIVKKFQSGVLARTLAEEYNCEHTTIYRILDQAGVPRNRRKFDGELADTLREEYERGATTTALAEKYGTTRQRVSRYIREAGGKLRPSGPQRQKV